MDKSDIFIKNADAPLAQYTMLKQKKLAGLLEKNIFKVVTSADILNNIRIFNSCFVDKVKHADIHKDYEKIWLVV